MPIKFQLIAVLLALLSPVILSAKNYSIDRVEIYAVIHNDGSVSYTEHRTYSFRGSFSKANYELSKRGFNHIRDIRVREGDMDYLMQDSSTPGSFTIRDRSRSVDIRWRYRAQNETRTFTISYVLEGAVIRGPSDAEFYWTFLSNRWEKDTRALYVTLVFEQSQELFDVLTWVHGATHLVNLQQNTDGFSLQSQGSISRNSQIQVRTIFPTEVVSDMSVNDPTFSRALAQAQEDERVLEKLNRERSQEAWLSVGRPISLVLIPLSVLIWIGFYQRWGRAPHLGVRQPDVLYNPPSELPPAIIGRFMMHTTTAQHVVATMFDLSRRGYFRMRETEPDKGLLKSKAPVVLIQRVADVDLTELAGFERSLYDFITSRMTATETRVDELFKRKTTQTTKWFQKWSGEVSTAIKEMNWKDHSVTRYAWIHALIQFMLLIISFVVLINSGAFGQGVVAMVTTLVMLLFSATISRRTIEGEQTFRNWKAYKSGLKGLNAKRTSPNLAGRHIIYAVALHLTTKRILALVDSLQINPDDLTWFVFMNFHGNGFTSLGSTIGSITSTLTTSVSVAGAGASAGAAGGGAGGGAS